MIIPKLPQYSPKATVEQTIGVTDVKVTYFRPSARGRAIFGSLVPYNEVWRTAANSGTRITFSGPVELAGVPVPAGEYALLTRPGPDHWQVMLNSSQRSLLAAPYDASLDAVNVRVPVEQVPFTETFTVAFDHLSRDAARLTLTWGVVRVSLELAAPATEQGSVHVAEALAEPDVTPSVLHSCAAFCLDRGKRLPEALAWAERSVNEEPRFFSVRTLALLYAANGRWSEAFAAARRSLEMSRAAGQDGFVRLNEETLRAWEQERAAI